MTTHRRKLLPFCIAAALLSGPAVAVGLGEIQLTSYLGKPLQAEVALNSLGDLSADQMKISIGSEADYQALGVEYSYLHTLLKIEPFVRGGRGYVRITTREPISEPYLNFVLNVQWPQGRVVREFTVLLDPAPIAAVAATQPERARLTESAVASQESVQPVARSRRSVQKPASASVPASEQSQSPAPTESRDGDYIVQRGDSLWRIAERLSPQNAELQQVMNAIVAQNPHAFVNGNPNRIKEAARIVVPSAEQIAAVGVPVTGAPERATAKVSQGDVAAPAVPVELVEENSALKAQVTALTSNVDGLNQNLEQSEQRLHQLESQLDTLLQQMQQQRATLAALSGEKSPIETVAPATGSMINQVNASDLRPVAAAHTPWWVHLLYWLGIGGAAMWAIREHFWPRRTLALLGGGELASGAFGAEEIGAGNSQPFAARTASVTPREDHSWRPSVAQPSPVLDDFDLDEPAPVTEVEESIVLSAAPPALDRDAEDPIVDVSISAGVFLAFGRYDEAERLLRDALKHAPGRIELKLQLLDVYMQADQPEVFEALAEEIEQESTAPEVLAELAVLRESYRARGH